MPSDESDFSNNAKTLIVALVIFLWVVYFGFLISAFAFDTSLKAFFTTHMGPGIAVPLAGLSAFLLVSLLEISSGPVKFEGLGIKLSGAAGPVIFWVICFLAIILGIRIVP